jgi:hypothetical protein
VLIVVVVDTSHVLMMLVVRHVLVRISFHISGIICERCDRICSARIVIISFFFLVPLSRSQSLSVHIQPSSNHDRSFLFTAGKPSWIIGVRILHFRLPRETLLKQKDLTADFIA